MLFRAVTVEAVSIVLPPRVVSSAEVEQSLAPLYDRLKLPFGRLEMMTGIRERRFWQPGTRPSEAATSAGKKALAAAEVAPSEIGCLIHASVCRDFLEPATAAVVHERLGLSETCAIFDLSNACLGVLNAMAIAAEQIESGRIQAALIVAGETAEGLYEATVHTLLHDRTLDRNSLKRHFASLTIGSAAAAVILRHASRSRTGHRLLGGAVRTDSRGHRLCQEDTAAASTLGPLMATDAEGLLQAGCALAQRTWEAAKQTLGWDNESPRHIFTHQVGQAHRRATFALLGLDPARDFPTFPFLGNTGAAALPGAWALGMEQRRINAGDLVALLGIGSGLSSLMLGLEW